MGTEQIRQEMGRFELGQLVDLEIAHSFGFKSSNVYVAYAGICKPDTYMLTEKREEDAVGTVGLKVYELPIGNIRDADAEAGRVVAFGSQSGIDRSRSEYSPAARALNVCRANQAAKKSKVGVDA